MKYLALIPLVIVSCTTKPQVSVHPKTISTTEPVSSVRYGEVIRSYNIGRYVDSEFPQTMHEAHAVYRVEALARWDLHPGSNLLTPLNPPPDSALCPPSANDALVAEMNRQREVTGRVMLEATKLANSYNELGLVLGEMKNVASNNVALSRRIATNELQMAVFGKELQKVSGSVSMTTNTASEMIPDSTNPKAP